MAITPSPLPTLATLQAGTLEKRCASQPAINGKRIPPAHIQAGCGMVVIVQMPPQTTSRATTHPARARLAMAIATHAPASEPPKGKHDESERGHRHGRHQPLHLRRIQDVHVRRRREQDVADGFDGEHAGDGHDEAGDDSQHDSHFLPLSGRLPSASQPNISENGDWRNCRRSS